MEATGDTPGLTMKTSSEGDILVVDLEGTIELATVQGAKDGIAEAWPEDTPKILFDLSGVRFVDSAGLGFLIGTLRRASEAGGDLKLSGLSSYLLGIFELVNLGKILKVYKTRDDALEAFSA